MDEQEWLPKLHYYLEESDPDVVVLRRQDGTFVAAFSAQGATREGILAAAYVDYRRLASRLRAGAERASFLEELPEHAAVVEGSGTIVAANKAWKRFAKDNGADPEKVSEGANYLGVCDEATGEQSGVRPILRRRASFGPVGQRRALRPEISLPLAYRKALVRGERGALGRRRRTPSPRLPRERGRPQSSALESSKAEQISENFTF